MDRATKRPVVAGIDGSASALRAVDWAATQAALRGVALRLVHAYQIPAAISTEMVYPQTVRNTLRAQGRRFLRAARVAAARVAPDVPCMTVLEFAPSVPLLVEESDNASLVVLGSRGLGGFTGLLLGSTAVQLASRAHGPVVVVRGDVAAGPAGGHVAVGVDGAPAGEAAIAFAFEEASRHGCGLTAVHAWTGSLLDTALLGREEPPDFVVAQQRAYEILAERLAGWQEKYPDVLVTREVIRDHPARAVLRYATGARLVVSGTRGRGAFGGLVLGSTSQHLLHHAPCPGAIVRAQPE